MSAISPAKPGAAAGEAPLAATRDASMRRRLIVGRVAISIFFFVIYALLDRPDVILISNLGFTAWCPPVGLSMALLLGVSPWYAPVVWASNSVAGALIYHQPIGSWSGTLGALCTAGVYAIAAYMLRARFRIDFGMKRQRDVLRYLCVTLLAALIVTAVNTACLVGDGTISRGQYRHAAFIWFTGDAVALVGIAPFLLIYVVPWSASGFL